MQLSTLFSRAWAQKYLTPAERALYKFFVAIIVLVPAALLLSGVDAALIWLHTSLPPMLWQVLAVVLPALLMAFAKYATAHGDANVGAIIQQVEAEAEKDLAPANANPVRVPTALVMPPDKPTTSA